jgi:hypothetical protein
MRVKFSTVLLYPSFVLSFSKMLFRTTLLVTLLAAFTSVISAPIDTNALSERSEESSLLVRDIGYDDLLEERDLPLEERDVDDLYEFITRSPVPEPLPSPEIEDVERRGKLGFLVKIGKGIANLVHKGHKASNAVQNNNNNNNQHHKRSKIGDKFKNFFKKVGNGVSDSR